MLNSFSFLNFQKKKNQWRRREGCQLLKHRHWPFLYFSNVLNSFLLKKSQNKGLPFLLNFGGEGRCSGRRPAADDLRILERHGPSAHPTQGDGGEGRCRNMQKDVYNHKPWST